LAAWQGTEGGAPLKLGRIEGMLKEDSKLTAAKNLPSSASVEDDVLKAEIQKYLQIKSNRANREVRPYCSAQNTGRISFETMGFDDFEVTGLQFSEEGVPEVLTKEMSLSLLECDALKERLELLESSVESVSKSLLDELETRDDLHLSNEQLKMQIRLMHEQVEAYKKKASQNSKKEACLLY
jgi:hypothetical protein